MPSADTFWKLVGKGISVDIGFVEGAKFPDPDSTVHDTMESRWRHVELKGHKYTFKTFKAVERDPIDAAKWPL